MAGDIASLSLIDACSETGFRASVIATYSCYFPFYEEVLLRRLVASGSTHNVLMVDASMFAEAMAADDLRPQRAGRDYTLIPVRLGGAFHPKLILRAGKSKGTLLVGSHNVTLSGFGLNDEVTSVFTAEGRSARTSAAPLRAAFKYLAGFVPANLQDVGEAFEGVRHGVPWLEDAADKRGDDRLLLTTTSTGGDLWTQVLPLVPAKSTSAFICGPFFDERLGFVRRLVADTQVQDVVIGIDPATVEIDPVAAKLPGVRFVNVAGKIPMPDRPEGSAPVVHAKILWFKGPKSELLVTGSANPTSAAFLGDAPRRNAEAVVADRRPDAQAEIGLTRILEAAAPVTDADWEAVAERRAERADSETGRQGRLQSLLATPTSQGFLVQSRLPSGLTFEGLDGHGNVIAQATVSTGDGTAIVAPPAVRDEAVFLRSVEAVEPVMIVVHRTEEVARNFGGDAKSALREALGALEAGPENIETLLKLVEKVIFDGDADIVRTGALHVSGERSPEAPEATETEVAPTSLALDAAGRPGQRFRRQLASRDVAVLLDKLIRRLGEGLPVTSTSSPLYRETPVGADEEQGGEEAKPGPDLAQVALACQGKVRRLVKRMIGQLELGKRPDQARRCVIQLASVLGIIFHLRTRVQNREWRMKALDPLDSKAEEELFEAATLALTWSRDALAHRATEEAGGQGFEELSIAVGLLAWTAWDLEVDVRVSFWEAGQQGVEDDTWQAAQFFALLGPWLATDTEALRVLEQGVERTPKIGKAPRRWFELHRTLAETMAQVQLTPEGQGQVGRRPQPGDLVILGERFVPRVRVVLDVVPQTRDVQIKVFDLDSEDTDGVRSFMSSKVASRPWRTSCPKP